MAARGTDGAFPPSFGEIVARAMKDLGLSRATVARRLSRMVEAGSVARTIDGRYSLPGHHLGDNEATATVVEVINSDGIVIVDAFGGIRVEFSSTLRVVSGDLSRSSPSSFGGGSGVRPPEQMSGGRQEELGPCCFEISWEHWSLPERVRSRWFGTSRVLPSPELGPLLQTGDGGEILGSPYLPLAGQAADASESRSRRATHGSAPAMHPCK